MEVAGDFTRHVAKKTNWKAKVFKQPSVLQPVCLSVCIGVLTNEEIIGVIVNCVWNSTIQIA
jgi:hypothetical protein